MLSLISGILYIAFVTVRRCSLIFFAGRYLRDIAQMSSSVLAAPAQRQANRPDAKITSHEERETQVYDRAPHGVGPPSH